MNLERLPIIGRAISNRRQRTEALNTIIDQTRPQVSATGRKVASDVLGGFFDFQGVSLSNEKTISTKLLKANKEWVYRNNDVIAMEVSKMEFELYSIGLSNGEIVFTEIESHPLLDLLDKPNAETVKSDAIYIIQSHKKLTGDAFWLKLRNGKQVVALRQLPPDKIELDLQTPTESDPTVIKQFVYKDKINNEDIEIKYQPEDIIHFKKPNPNNHFRGYGSVEALAETIDVDNLTNQTTMNFFRKGAITNFVLSTEQKLNDSQIKRFEAQMRSMYGGGTRNAYKTMILGGGLKPEKLTFSNKDMEFLAQLAWYRDKIMVGFGNTLASLGMLDDVNRATHESSMIEWKRNTVKPDMDSIVNALNEFLVPEFGANLILAYVDPIPEDRTDDIAEATQLYSGGVMMLNEARELLDLESVEGGDTFYSPMGNTPASLDTGDNDEVIDQEIEDIEDSEGEGSGNKAITSSTKKTKIYRRKKRKANSSIPDYLTHMDIKALLRRRGIYMKQRVNKELKAAIKPIVKQIMKDYKSKGKPITVEKAAALATKSIGNEKYQPPTHSKFSAEQIMDYYEKQVSSVKTVEKHFEEAIVKYLSNIQSKFLDNLSAEVEAKKSLNTYQVKDFFDDEDDALMTQAQIDFAPLLENLSSIAGQRASDLVADDHYVPGDAMRAKIRANVEKFTRSMLETDREVLTDIITNGIGNGLSVVEIRNQITEHFDEYSKKQAQRIGRTEVLRTSTQSALDAWEQSGVVEGKQWITAGATDECADYEGATETLSSNFYDEISEFADGDPPLHPNCRCVLIPIVVDTKAFPVDLSKTNANLRQKIADLEGQLDKRTKQAKEVLSQRREDRGYIKILENHLGIDDVA
jgi:HK97 family phage portal protein